jgi:hypothetical protein
LVDGVKILHAGKSRSFVKEAIGSIMMLPSALLKRLFTGRLSSKGLWYILGF